MFLLREDADTELPADEAYDFVPYNYGPMSKAIYADLDGLIADGSASAQPVEGQSWSLFRATSRGLRQAQRLVNGMSGRDTPLARKLYEIKQLVAGKTLDELVDYVYERWPEYESQSVFRRLPASRRSFSHCAAGRARCWPQTTSSRSGRTRPREIGA